MEKGIIPPDGLASRYDKLHGLPSEACNRARTFPPITGAATYVAGLLEKYRGNLIELGCGRGELLLQCHDRFDLKVGVDFSRVFLRDAELFAERFSRERPKIKWLAHDLNQPLPFEDGTFDVAISVACIEHVFDVYGVFREVRRCLKGGGVFIFAIPNLAYVRHRLRLLFGRQIITGSPMELWSKEYWDGTHIHYFTLSAVKMLLGETGFLFIENSGSGRVRSIRKWWPTLLCGDLIVTAKKR